MRHTFLVVTVKMVKIGVHYFMEVIAKLKQGITFWPNYSVVHRC